MKDSYKNVAGKLLRCGYTTGSCATVAAKGAAMMLLGQKAVSHVSIATPKGISLNLDLLDVSMAKEVCSCAVQKDSGDDPDVTNGILIYATVRFCKQNIVICGGKGVGKVTMAGLDQPVGEAAINSIPRQMITTALEEVCQQFGYTGGLEVTISVPEGEEIAKRTFNSRIGIIGGISIIGTSGIVEPMSNAALIDTIALEMRQHRLVGHQAILLTPGNYGESFASLELGLDLTNHIVCSNFIGESIDTAVELGYKTIFIIGHIGKLVKLGIGITNTHSANGDGRIETLLGCALEAGANLAVLHKVQACVMTDAALEVLSMAGILKQTMQILGQRIEATLYRRVPNTVDIGFLCFTNAKPFAGILAQSQNATKLLTNWR